MSSLESSQEANPASKAAGTTQTGGAAVPVTAAPLTAATVKTAPQAASTPAAVAGSSVPAAAASSAGSSDLPEIVYDDFAKIQLVVATIIEAAAHPNADKLLVLQIDIGNGQRRQICAGIKAWYDPATLVGKQIVVVKNLAPRPLRGQVSHGMLLAATDAATGNVVVLSPSTPVASGSSIK